MRAAHRLSLPDTAILELACGDSLTGCIRDSYESFTMGRRSLHGAPVSTGSLNAIPDRSA